MRSGGVGRVHSRQPMLPAHSARPDAGSRRLLGADAGAPRSPPRPCRSCGGNFEPPVALSIALRTPSANAPPHHLRQLRTQHDVIDLRHAEDIRRSHRVGAGREHSRDHRLGYVGLAVVLRALAVPPRPTTNALPSSRSAASCFASGTRRHPQSHMVP